MTLRNVLTVATRDFLAVVRTKGFVIGLLFMPAIVTLSSTVLPKLFKSFEERGERRFAVADFTGKVAGALAVEMREHNARPGQSLTIALEPAATPLPAPTSSREYVAARDRVVDELAGRVRSDELFGFLVVGPDVLAIPKETAKEPNETKHDKGSDADEKKDDEPRAEVLYRAASLTTGDLHETIARGLATCVRRLRFVGVAPNLDPTTIDRIERELEPNAAVVSRRPGEESGRASNGIAEHAVPITVCILMLMGIMQSAGLLLTSTIEEKSNRVVEVLLSSISSFELLAGKVLGAWCVGLVMLVAWGGAAATAANHHGWLPPGMLEAPNLAWFVFFFLAGYLLFASLYASVGAMCSTIQDAQSMMLPIVLLIMIPMLSMTFVLGHPDSGLAHALTWFPFSAPFIASMRLTLSPPAPQWQIVVAAASVALSAWFLLWLGAKVFRTVILMSGKPPKPAELWRMLRES